MAEDRLKKLAIDAMCAAVQDIRDCPRCCRAYGAAFDVLMQEGRLVFIPYFNRLHRHHS